MMMVMMMRTKTCRRHEPKGTRHTILRLKLPVTVFLEFDHHRGHDHNKHDHKKDVTIMITIMVKLETIIMVRIMIKMIFKGKIPEITKITEITEICLYSCSGSRTSLER